MVVYCILFIWRTNFLNEQRRIRGHLNDNVTTATSTSKGGLDLKVIETFPVIAYSDIKNQKKIDTNERVVECAVCLGEYENEDMLRLLPICRHVFHCHCIDAWFISHSTCPVCRSNMGVIVPEAALGSVIDVFEEDGSHSESAMTVINVTAEQTHVSVSVAESSEQATDGVNLNKKMNPNQTTGRSVNPFATLSRSHSTGHSLVPENSERHTLGSPDDVRKASVNAKLNRQIKGFSLHKLIPKNTNIMIKKSINLLIGFLYLNSINLIPLLLLLLPFTSAQINDNEQHNKEEYFYILMLVCILTGFTMIIVVVAICVPALTGLLANCIRGSRVEQRGSRVDPNNFVGRSSAGGLDSVLIQMFPVLVYSDIKNLKEISNDCAVCLSEYEDKDMLRLLPKCQHVFHRECIDSWLVSHATCPVCRSNLNPIASETASNGGVGGGAHSVIDIFPDDENHADTRTHVGSRVVA
ncbi:hypothetical protein MKW92_006455 [Papaver armeniacum]|nr:hypothetical protein MKW92_006455 [Papaver armeniacum]